MAINIWTPRGQLAGLTARCNPNVIYEGNPQILGGPNVFKMWAGVNNGVTGIYYYESADGITSWTAFGGNPVVAATAGNSFPTVYKVGSTYYMYTGPYPGGTGISVRTSSDGITWGSPTLAIAIGGGGSWEATGVAQLNLVRGTPGFGTGTGETYYGYYFGAGAGGGGEGLATSTDLINWTKNGSNPILSGVAPMTFQNINGIYYAWAPGFYNAVMGAKGFNNLARWSSSFPNGPWTSLQYNGIPQDVIYHCIRADFDYGGTGTNPQGTSIGDPSMLSALGNMYVYWTRTTVSGIQSGINMAVATGITPTQQVAGYEGMVGFPHPYPLFNAELNALASDNFTRANANPITPNWTPVGATASFGDSQVLSNFASPSTITKNGENFYNAVSFPNDQFSSVTLHTLNAGCTAGAGIRMSTVANEYRFAFTAAAGGLGLAGALGLLPIVAGVGTGNSSSLSPSMVVNANDVLTVVSNGTNLLGYWNGFPAVAITGSELASGGSGFADYANNTVVGNVQISAWSGGGFVAAPNAPGIGGGIGRSVVAMRRNRRGF